MFFERYFYHHQASCVSKTEVFCPKDEGRSGRGPLLPEKKRKFWITYCWKKAYRPVFCVIEKICRFARFHFKPHRKCSVTIFMYAHGKLDLAFFKAMSKLSWCAVRERKTSSLTEMCTHLSRKRREDINHESWITVFCLVSITSTSPEVGMTAIKQFPEKKR